MQKMNVTERALGVPKPGMERSLNPADFLRIEWFALHLVQSG